MPPSRLEALIMVAPAEMPREVQRLSAALQRLGMARVLVPRHGTTRVGLAIHTLWRKAGIRASETLTLDGCDEGCSIPRGTHRVRPERALEPLVEARRALEHGALPAIPDDGAWTIAIEGAEPELEWMHDSWLAMVDGVIGTQGSPLTGYAPARREVMVAGVYHGTGPSTDALRAPDWTRLAGHLRTDRPLRRVLDLRTGLVHHEGASTAGSFRGVAFASRALPGLGVLRALGGGARSPSDGPLAAVHHADGSRPDNLPRPAAGEEGTQADGKRRVRPTPTIAEVAGEPGGVAIAARDVASAQGSLRRLDRLAAHVVGRYREPSARAASRMLHDAEHRGFEWLIDRQRVLWARRWEEMGIRVEGDPALQRAVNFSLFHLDASIAKQPEAPLGPRGLTGPGYKAHVFWDSECYVLPFFAATRPRAARAMLMYRAKRIEAAQAAAREAGLAGAWFPWESAADGRDVTPRWIHGEDELPIRVWTGERELHVVSDIAWAVDHYVAWSGDRAFATGDGLRILVETARFWASRFERESDGRAHVRGVIGPDEYHELVDDDAFTNVMARWNLRTAAAAVRQAQAAPGRAPARLMMPTPGELDAWEELATAIVDGYDPGTRIYEQFDGFHSLESVRIAELSSRPVAADVLLGRERVEAAQVVKQAAVVLLHHLVPDEVAPGSLVPNLDYYEPRTAHGSSLSPGAYATLLARAGRTEAALETLRMTAELDLDDRTGKAAQGLHIPTMGALWQALVMGFGGIRPRGDALAIEPRLPQAWSRLEIPLRFRGRRMAIAIEADRIRVRGTPASAFVVPGTGPLTMTGRRLELRREGDGWAVA